MNSVVAISEAPPIQPVEPSIPRFDRAAIHAHVSMLHNLARESHADGQLILACYGENPDTGRKTGQIVRRFAIGDVDMMVNEIMSLEDHPHLNVYVPWAVYRRGLIGTERGGKNDVVCTLALVADLDADTGKVGELPLPASYVIESSAGNFQAVYPFARPLPPNEAEPLAKALQQVTGADHGTGDIAHVWRGPGTLNWPNKKKLDRGRPRDPQAVKVATPWAGELVEPEKLWEAVAAHSKPNGANGKGSGHNHGSASWQLRFMALPATTRKLITSPPSSDEDRSAIAASVIASLIKRGWTNAQIAAVIQAHPEGVGQRYDEGSDLEADIARLRGKYGNASAALPELSLDADPVAVARKLAGLISERRDILLNGYTPVRVIHEIGQDPRAVELTPKMVRAYAHEIVRCVKTDKDGDIYDAPLKPDIAKLYVYGLEGEWGLRPLRGISTSPLLASDGSIRTASGYDEDTGLWCHDVPDVSVPDRPTREDAQKALLTLRQAFSTFPYGDAAMLHDATGNVDVVDLSHPPGLDESTHLVALMTSVCRACLPLAPAFLYTSSLFSGAGVGKGLLVKSVCVVGSGVRPSAMTAGHSVEELDKRLVAAAIEARPAIYLDNFNEGTLESDTLASFLTEDPARVRVLGHTKTVPLHTRAFVGITGNAVQIAEDMARRILTIVLDARKENPEQRPFEPGFLPNIFARRAELLAACLTIWRWGVQQGDKLPRGRSIGSYELWARWCRDPLLALGCRDPVERIADIKAADPKRRQIVEVLEAWWRHHADRWVTGGELHGAVKELIDPDAKRNGDEVYYSRQKISAFLRRHADVRIGAFHLERGTTERTEFGNQAVRYRVVKTGDHGA
jgi:RepB DNA-primase from phage plasmid